MHPSIQKSHFSIAYARAVAAVAGVAVSVPEVDDDSIDLRFEQKAGGGLVRSPRLEAQIKGAESAILHPQHLAYDLKLKNYDDLRYDDVMVPRILIVVTVAKDLGDWLQHSEQELVLRHCGYWLSLRGQPPTANATKVAVHLPRAQQFNVDALQGMMQRIGNGQLP